MSPNCKVCRDAGKSEQECSSHWVREKNGRVTCPTLLSQKCRNCGKSGHTVKYCKVARMSLLPQSTEKKEPKKVNQPENIYAALADDQPDPDATPRKTTYLDILAKEAPQIVNLKDIKKSTFNFTPIKLKHSWASETSSDTEEDTPARLLAVQM